MLKSLYVKISLKKFSVKSLVDDADYQWKNTFTSREMQIFG